jgi:hypothetical protein
MHAGKVRFKYLTRLLEGFEATEGAEVTEIWEMLPFSRLCDLCALCGFTVRDKIARCENLAHSATAHLRSLAWPSLRC